MDGEYPFVRDAAQDADMLFDELSEALREHRDPRATKTQLRNALQRADELFDELVAWFAAGRELPDPLRRRYMPRPDGV